MTTLLSPVQAGGWLALEQTFDVIPLPTDSHGDDVMYRLLGSRSYELSPSPIGELVTPSIDYGKEVPQGVILLPEMGEHLLYPASIIDGGKMWDGGQHSDRAARYSSKEPGEVRWLDGEGEPGLVALVSMKVTADQVGSYVEIEGWESGTGFVWRGFLTKAELNQSWVILHSLYNPIILR